MGNNTEFERAVLWLSENLTFNVDARINLFEVCDWKIYWKKFSLVDSKASSYMIIDYSNLMKPMIKVYISGIIQRATFAG